MAFVGNMKAAGASIFICISILLIHLSKLVSYLQMIIFLCSHKQSISDWEQKEKVVYCSYRSNHGKVSAKENENISHVPSTWGPGLIKDFRAARIIHRNY